MVQKLSTRLLAAALFAAGFKMCPGQSDHKWTAETHYRLDRRLYFAYPRFPADRMFRFCFFSRYVFVRDASGSKNVYTTTVFGQTTTCQTTLASVSSDCILNVSWWLLSLSSCDLITQAHSNAMCKLGLWDAKRKCYRTKRFVFYLQSPVPDQGCLSHRLLQGTILALVIIMAFRWETRMSS